MFTMVLTGAIALITWYELLIRNPIQIEKSLDTGDLLFFNYNCMNCLEPSEVLLCLA